MFDEIERQSHAKLQEQIDKLKEDCERNPDVAEMVRYLIAGYHGCWEHTKNYDAGVGSQIEMMLWSICGVSIHNSSNLYISWAGNLNFFIGNFVYDDSVFDFDVDEHNGLFTFKASNDSGRWLQDPRIIVEAAKANTEYYRKSDYGILSCIRAKHKVDPSKVYALLKEEQQEEGEE